MLQLRLKAKLAIILLSLNNGVKEVKNSKMDILCGGY